MSIKLKNVSKSYDSIGFLKKKANTVLKEISFELKEDDIIGIIGPNGAGKTTLLKIILNLILPSSGKVDIENRNQKQISFVNSNSRSFFWRISARDNLVFHGKLLNIRPNILSKRIDKLSIDFNVSDILDKPFMHLSSGQMQVFNVLRGLLRKPDYIFFDEPTVNMDRERSTHLIGNIKSYLKKNKIPTVWCSHNFDEIALLCNRFFSLNNGKIVNLDKEAFLRLKNKNTYYCFEVNKFKVDKLNEEKIKIIDKLENTFLIRFIDENLLIDDMIKIIKENNLKIYSIEKMNDMKDFNFD